MADTEGDGGFNPPCIKAAALFNSAENWFADLTNRISKDVGMNVSVPKSK